MKILCLKHVDYEAPFAIAKWATGRGHTINTIAVYRNASFPNTDSFDALLIMGGPMNVHEDKNYPWLTREKAFISESIKQNKIIIGICLGAQIIADALGAAVVSGNEKEIGWFPIQRSCDCPSEVPFPETLRVFHWHGDTFALPEGATHVAGSSAFENQAFLYENRILGLQCHLESTPDSVRTLLEFGSGDLQDSPFVMKAEEILAEPMESYSIMHKVLFELLDNLYPKIH